MKNKNFARVVAILLAAIMLISVVIGAISAITSLRARAAVTQAEIDRLRQEKQQYAQRKLEIQARINTIEFERMSEVARKSVLDDRIILTGQEIENIRETIDYYSLLIIEKEGEVTDAQNRENEQLTSYRRRVREMEECGVISYLEILFDSTSFTDLLARLDFISDIMHADERMYYNLIDSRLQTIAARETLVATRLEMEEEEALLEIAEQELLEQLEEANALIETLENNIERERQLYADARAEEERIQREINSKVEELRREQERRQIAESQRVRGTGDLLWPAPGHNSITSRFGIRLHPVYRVLRQHTGIDIGAPYGARVVAADTGTVITSSYNSSYGNYIVVSHGSTRLGSNVTTLYAHLSIRNVSAGDVVSRGTTIGRVGSTGVSTGAHLHFEVSINGTRVNPERYL